MMSRQSTIYEFVPLLDLLMIADQNMNCGDRGLQYPNTMPKSSQSGICEYV